MIEQTNYQHLLKNLEYLKLKQMVTHLDEVVDFSIHNQLSFIDTLDLCQHPGHKKVKSLSGTTSIQEVSCIQRNPSRDKPLLTAFSGYRKDNSWISFLKNV